MLIVTSDSQPSNALFPITETELGISTVVRSLLFLNVPSGISVSSLERMMDLSWDPANAPAAIDVTVSGISNVSLVLEEG